NAKSDWEGRTPLHYAADKGRKEVAVLLIANGADVNAKARDDIKGTTPLDSANMGSDGKRGGPPTRHEKNRTETADLLRKHGGKTGEELK
ncbi:MAG: ankyrin repeat domain-containing protein, partial [Nitrospinaceae bacterium]|nr:ankyrin repeat domain-containing protein [Nitrospinaceae bacterium]